MLYHRHRYFVGEGRGFHCSRSGNKPVTIKWIIKNGGKENEKDYWYCIGTCAYTFIGDSCRKCMPISVSLPRKKLLLSSLWRSDLEGVYHLRLWESNIIALYRKISKWEKQCPKQNKIKKVFCGNHCKKLPLRPAKSADAIDIWRNCGFSILNKEETRFVGGLRVVILITQYGGLFRIYGNRWSVV